MTITLAELAGQIETAHMSIKDWITVDSSMKPGEIRWHSGGFVSGQLPKAPKTHTARYDEGEDPFQYTKRDDDDAPVRLAYTVDTEATRLDIETFRRMFQGAFTRPEIPSLSEDVKLLGRAANKITVDEWHSIRDDRRHEKEYGWYRKHSRNKWENRP